MRITHWLAVSAAIMSLLTLPSGANARQAPLVEPERVVLAKLDGNPLTEAKVRDAILAGGREHGWYPTEDKPGQLVLRYDRGTKHTTIISVDYDAASYLIRYRSSVNMNYAEVDGVREIHPNYNRWIQILIRSINEAAIR